MAGATIRAEYHFQWSSSSSNDLSRIKSMRKKLQLSPAWPHVSSYDLFFIAVSKIVKKSLAILSNDCGTCVSDWIEMETESAFSSRQRNTVRLICFTLAARIAVGGWLLNYYLQYFISTSPSDLIKTRSHQVGSSLSLMDCRSKLKCSELFVPLRVDDLVCSYLHLWLRFLTTKSTSRFTTIDKFDRHECKQLHE